MILVNSNTQQEWKRMIKETVSIKIQNIMFKYILILLYIIDLFVILGSDVDEIGK